MAIPRIKKETLQHKKAFEQYLSLGDKRSYAKLAKEIGVTVQTIQKWGASFNWQKKIEERERELAIELVKQTDKQILKDKIRYRELIQKSISVFETKLANNQVDINTVKDLSELIKLDLGIMGLLDRGTADVMADNNIATSTETQNTINSLIDGLADIEEPEDLDSDEYDIDYEED